MRSTIHSVLFIFLFALQQPAIVKAYSPQLQMSEKGAENLILEGDRLADQGEYLEAVQRYTKAYLGIVAKLRQQEFKNAVEPSLMTRSELSQEMKKQMEIEYTEEELKLMDSSYKVFGLIPQKFSVKETMTKLLTEEVGGFYDPRTKAMVLVREDDRERQPGFLGKLLGQRPTFDKEEQKVTLSHELTHALQDQLYGLLEKQKAIEKDDDMSMAFSALVEGDATLVMFGEMGRQEGDIRSRTEMDPEAARLMFNVMKLMLPVAGGKTYRSSPPIFRDGLIFPYFQGLIFNLNLSRAGGFERVHEAYENPPVSTEQILHPSKYYLELDEPWTIEIPDAAKVFPRGWKHLGGNCLGEFQISIMFQRVPNGSKAAAGWDGDRYEVFENDEGALGMAWCTIWDSDEDANEFAQAFTKYGKQRELLDQILIEKAGPRVWIVQGLLESEAASVMASIKKASETPKVFPK